MTTHFWDVWNTVVIIYFVIVASLFVYAWWKGWL